MTWFVLVSVYCVLSYSTISVAGQCTVSSCAVSDSGSDERLQVSLEEHDYRLETMNQNMGSAFKKLEAAVNRTNARGQEELCQDLKTLYYNMSVNLERVSENIPDILEYQTTPEQEEYLRILNLSLTSMTVRTEECIQAVNESLSYTLQTADRSLNEKFQVMQVQLQNQAFTLQNVNRSLDEKFQVMQVQLQSQAFAIQNVNRSLDEKFQVMQVQLQSQSSALQNVNRSLDEKLQVMQVQLQSQAFAIQNVNRSLDEKFQMMQVQLSSLINDSVVSVLRELQEKFQTLNDSLLSAVDKINEKLNTTLDRLKESNQSVEFQVIDVCRNDSVVCDCSDIKAIGYTASGVYRIYVVDQGQRYYANALCDMTTTNGAWTVFQRRQNGSVKFFREWNEYANGFGSPSGSFWLGNNFLHLLTSKRRYRLRIDLEDFEGEKRYAEYSTFDISSSANKYRLRIGTYSGTAGDSIGGDNGYSFSTKDNDNDGGRINCAFGCHGAWWFNGNCSASNLNGLYLHGRYSSHGVLSGWEGIHWLPWHGQWYSLKTTEIKISS